MIGHHKALTRAKRTLRHMTPGHIVKTRLTARVVQEFAEKVGMVYFGYVDQKDDDHRLVRGHTVSSTHIDNHYCVGSFRGYDVSLVTRNDVVLVGKQPAQREQRCHWLICTVDLHTPSDLPHVYIGHHTREEAFKASYQQLHPIEINAHTAYPAKFLSNYTTYGIPGESIEIEDMITPQIAEVIAHHFHEASIEIEDNTLYLYIESQHPREVLLEKMLSNGLWLAEAIDAASTPQVT